MRQLTPGWVLATSACIVSCAGLQVRDQLRSARGTPIVTVDRLSFDGEYLDGRLLVGSDDAGHVVIDRRLAAHAILAVDDVFDCDGGAPVKHIQADSIITPPRPEDFLTIQPGYWFGSDFHLLVYAEDILKEPPPACIQPLLAVNLAATGPAGNPGRPQLSVRAYLTAPDAGEPSPGS